MSGAHAEVLYVPRSTPAHHLPPQAKIMALAAFTVLVVVTPRTEVLAFGSYAVILLACMGLARISPIRILKRSVVELPFLLLAVAFPFLMSGPTVELWGLAVSEAGLWAGFNLAAKATLGVWAALLFSATTPIADILAGLSRLKLPDLMVEIAAFAVRYGHLTWAEVTAQNRARLARGYNPRFLWQAAAIARGLGTIFVRSFERGERVWMAMTARGYTGRLPLDVRPRPCGVSEWAVASTPVVAAAAVLAAVLVW
ncbi:cobalt ECF transporter T component CbiQ [Haloglycomyces albus]|uniref:cobalt ECF transporter T component CbiQ n=1 Tax=Haloglycomyces albus TaxID=526067 RepID=UPI00046CC4C3|nr:cobalt ECF transporter T component CbiQ [Haloglycomyces albus]